MGEVRLTADAVAELAHRKYEALVITGRLKHRYHGFETMSSIRQLMMIRDAYKALDKMPPTVRIEMINELARAWRARPINK